MSFGVFHKVTVRIFVGLISFHGMFCPGCGSEKDVAEATYCENCVSEKTTRDLIICYFNRGYPYAAIVGLLAANGVQMCVRTLKRRLRSLGLKRKGSVVDEDHLKHVIGEEMQDAGRLSGYRSVWHALRLRHGIHISRHLVARLMKEIDPIGVQERKARRLHRRQYRSEGANACWHIDGRFYLFHLVPVGPLCISSFEFLFLIFFFGGRGWGWGGSSFNKLWRARSH